jgi:hypothetical protein
LNRQYLAAVGGATQLYVMLSESATFRNGLATSIVGRRLAVSVPEKGRTDTFVNQLRQSVAVAASDGHKRKFESDLLERNMAKITFDKIEAASRQLTTAIELWFADGDPVSIHTLACSAYQIVHDINEKTGGPDLLYDSLVVKDEYRTYWINTIKRAYNFSKHADRDPNDTMELEPSVNDGFIIYTCLGLEVLGSKPNIARAAFTLCQMLTKPEILTESGTADLEKFPQSVRDAALSVPKLLFFQTYSAYWKTLGRK